jgi:hypothetical protein
MLTADFSALLNDSQKKAGMVESTKPNLENWIIPNLTL